MEVILISVPYTGTNFTAKLFTDLSFERLGMNDRPSWKDTIRVAHCIKPTQINPALRLSDTYPLVLPCRHPFRVEESYNRRGDSGLIDVMIKAFDTLICEFAPKTDLFMCVDSLERRQQLDYLAYSLDLPIKTEWEVIASHATTHRLALEDCNPSNAVIDLVDRHEGFFKTFYG